MADYPTRGEIVLGRIKRVNPFSAMVELTEYRGLEGMVHISEVSTKWVKDIRTHVKIGANVVAKVMRVDEQRGHINLSIKRVRPMEKEQKMKTVKNEQRAIKMLDMAAGELKASDVEKSKLAEQVRDKFGELFAIFEHSMTGSGKTLLEKKGFEKKWIDAIAEIAEKVMEIKEKSVKLEIDMKSYAGDGVEMLKKAAKSLDKEISVKYISAPRYLLEIKSKDAKKAERKLRKSVEKMKDILGKDGEIDIIE
jgi:translation initiation factor 2 subunit 1